VLTNFGANDDGGGTSSPSTCVFIRGANKQITLTNVDMTGSTSLPINIEGGSTFDYLAIRDCPGTPDRLVRPGDGVSSVSVPALTTVNATVKLVPTPAFGRSLYRIAVTARNTATGGTIFGSVLIGVTRESGNASATLPILDAASSGFGVLGTETLSLTLVNVAADGSTADIAVKSTHATQTHNVNYALTRII